MGHMLAPRRAVRSIDFWPYVEAEVIWPAAPGGVGRVKVFEDEGLTAVLYRRIKGRRKLVEIRVPTASLQKPPRPTR